ncbi:hypothetical protein SDC9_165875 [bioreactor metagenome]|uniref:Uncharacterized protein n=1 Tax=bioreactor metagenome TaxID=1076179 RepID=A0A645FVM8_9ZZZZ
MSILQSLDGFCFELYSLFSVKLGLLTAKLEGLTMSKVKVRHCGSDTRAEERSESGDACNVDWSFHIF